MAERDGKKHRWKGGKDLYRDRNQYAVKRVNDELRAAMDPNDLNP